MAEARPTTTTIKVSRRVMKHIESSARQDESVDETLRRLLKLGGIEAPKPEGPLPMTTTIKVSKTVMSYIKKSAKTDESRDMTLGRLLGVAAEDGNLPKAASVVKVNRKAIVVQPNDGNVRVKA